MKILILMRHGKAETSFASDAARPLTQNGRQEVFAHAQKLAAEKILPQLILSSPLLRAQQTAEIVSQTLQLPFQTETALDGRLSAKGLLALAQQQLQKQDSVMLIGHNPNMSIAAGILCQQYIPFDPATIMVFEVTDFARPKVI